MVEKLHTATEIVNRLGGVHSVAELLGVTAQAVCNMRTRGSFPPKHWPKILTAAKSARFTGVTLESLERLNGVERAA